MPKVNISRDVEKKNVYSLMYVMQSRLDLCWTVSDM